MKLNTQGLNELRKKVEEQLANVPEGQRVHIDKELLDDLIFFKGKNKDGRVIKVPVWTGQFLRKIDLSEISFENVLFQISFNGLENSIKAVMDAEDISRFIKLGDDRFPQYKVPFINDKGIDFSYTNANIDFSKICGTKIIGCNFEGIDFSKANGECLKKIYASNFSNTNIRINFTHEDLTLRETDFSNNDFSYATVDTNWFNFDDTNWRLINCNFSNTGLNITYVAPQIPPIYYEALKQENELYKLFKNGNISEEEYRTKDEKLSEITSQHSTDDFYKAALFVQIKEGHLNGCYINAKKVLSLEERQAIAQQKKAEYEKMKEDLIASTTSSIEQQASGFGRK